MEHIGLDIFDAALEKLKDFKGHAVICLRDEKDYADIFKFDSEEQFKEHFDFHYDNLYRATRLIPKLNEDEEFEFDGQGYYLNENELYHIVNGKVK